MPSSISIMYFAVSTVGMTTFTQFSWSFPAVLCKCLSSVVQFKCVWSRHIWPVKTKKWSTFLSVGFDLWAKKSCFVKLVLKGSYELYYFEVTTKFHVWGLSRVLEYFMIVLKYKILVYMNRFYQIGLETIAKKKKKMCLCVDFGFSGHLIQNYVAKHD